MYRRNVAVVAVGAVVLLLGGAIVLQQFDTGSTPADRSAAGGGSPAPAASSQNHTTAPPTVAPQEGVSEAGPGSGDQTTGDPAEPVAVQPLATMPLPDPASAVGSIVPGFPDQILPVAPNSSIESSSVATEGSQLQAALSAQTTLSADEVLAFYRARLSELGLSETPAPATEGSTALDFVRETNNISVTVVPMDGGCSYALFGTFTAQS